MKPLMFSVHGNGFVGPRAEVTEHEAGLAIVELIELVPVSAPAIWALVSSAPAAAPRNKARMVQLR